MDVSGLGISDLEGIEYFNQLETLNCSSNKLSGLRVAFNRKLTYLDCSDNQLTSMDLCGVFDEDFDEDIDYHYNQYMSGLHTIFHSNTLSNQYMSICYYYNQDMSVS